MAERDGSPAKSLRWSAIIPTRNRPEHAEGCARSVLANPGNFELIVVDQSSDEATAERLAKLGDGRMQVVRSRETGLSRARNLGAARASGRLLAFTDDDCRVPANWLTTFESALAARPEVEMVFGGLRLTGAEPGGWGAAFMPARESVQQAWPARDDGWGLGANLAIRREALEALNGFDPLLGAGTQLGGGEDLNLQMRALDGGRPVLYSPEPEVAHYGVRYGEEARALILVYSASFGATIAKQAALGSRAARGYLLSLLARKGVDVAARIARLKRPQGLAQILAVVRGYRGLGKSYGVERSRGWLATRS